MAELLDEVTEADQPTGKKITKHEAHEQGLPHRCVAIYVFDQNGSLYLQCHQKSNNRLDHSAGGHVRSGEANLDAAYRELEEELGISGVPLQEKFTHFFSARGRFRHVFAVYSCTAPPDWRFKPNSEVLELRKMAVSDVVTDTAAHPESYTSGFLATFERYRDLGRS